MLENKNIFYQLGEKSIRLITSLIITYALISTLDENIYGMMSTFMVINVMLMVLVTLGIKDKFVITLVNGQISKNLSFKICLTLFFLTLGILVAVQIALILNSTEKVEYLCASLISLQLISNLFIIGRYSSEASEKFKLISGIDLALNICSLPIKYYFIVFYNSLNLFLIVLALEMILSNALLFYLSRKKLFKDSNKPKLFLDLIRSSLPILLSSLIIIIYYRVDQVMISILVGYSETAIYAAGSKVTEILYFIPMTITAVLFPRMIREHNGNLELSPLVVKPLIFYLFWMSILTAIIISFLIEPVWEYFFQGKYQRYSKRNMASYKRM